MRTGLKFSTLAVAAILCLSSLNWASASAQTKRKAKKPAVPTLPSGPLGPVPQVPLDSTPAVAPHVSYRDGQLTIIAPNSTLGDILRAVKKQTAADMDIPANVNERVVTQLGPGTAREVVADLLNGSRFNYVLLGSPADSSVLTRVVLVPKAATPGAQAAAGQPQPEGADQAANVNAAQVQPEEPEAAESADAEAPPDENVDENADQTAEADQQPADQQQQAPQGVKTPQQMLQEMQQRQLQLQQQQPGQAPPVPGGYPQVPRPQEQPQQ
jgi:hypothetical protein